jgi:nucleoside-diphosphate-sugar epimerase
MRCLVTGVAGFVGSHLAERLVVEGHEVLGIDAFITAYPRELKDANLEALCRSPRFQLLEGDLSEIDLPTILAGREWVFHQAGQAGVRTSWGEHFSVYTQCNIVATQKLLEAAAHSPHLKRLVFASSSSVYGKTSQLPLSEGALPLPVSPYGVTKLAAEHLCMLYWHNYGVPVVALRYFTVYGPRQRPDMSFHIFGKALLCGQPIDVYGDGKQTRDFTYVDDIVTANVLAAETKLAEGVVMNIAGGSRISLLDAIDKMQDIARRKAHVRYLEEAKGDMRDTYADIATAERILGFRPKVELGQGLDAELNYLRQLYGL